MFIPYIRINLFFGRERVENEILLNGEVLFLHSKFF